MKILLANNFYYNRGGDCTYLFSVKKLLEDKGHKVIIFSMHHPKNFDSEYSNYFVSYINYAEVVKRINLINGIKVLNRAIYSYEARLKIEKLINREKPDIVHLHNIHRHLTPSILYSVKKYGIPIIWTLHDYTLICSNTTFLCRGKICERCKRINYFWPLIVRCKKESFAASAMAAIESTMHMIMGVYDLADIFISPSEFVMKKFIEYKFKKDKIINLSHFVESVTRNEREDVGDYYLYVGRISEEKGVKTLIDAASRVKKHRLKIVGDGPLREEMVTYAKLKNTSNTVEFLGYKSRRDVIELLRSCRFVVVPSEWYENFPFTILEAFASGKPVIGARLGGIPELVKDHKTGLTFEPGNADDLGEKIIYFMHHRDKIIKMGENARRFVEEKLSPEIHYKKLMGIYCMAMEKKRWKRR